MHDTLPAAILVATDMSPRGDRALARAVDLAAAFGARLSVLHVVDEDLPAPLRATLIPQAERLLAEQVAALPGAAAVAWTVTVMPGVDVAAIVEQAEQRDAGLVVLGMHREHPFRGIVFGTTAERVMRSGHCPVLVAKGAYRGPYRHILAAVDDSRAAGRALVAAARCWPQATVQAVHVEDVPAPLDGPAGAAFAAGPRPAWPAHLSPALATVEAATGRRPALLVQPGDDVADALRTLADRFAADLVAVGSAAGNRPMRALLGGTAERILDAAPCDVLVVPPG